MTRLMYTTLLLGFTVSTTVLTVAAELQQNTLTVDATDREGLISTTEAKDELQSRIFITSRGMRHLPMS